MKKLKPSREYKDLTHKIVLVNGKAKLLPPDY